MRTAMSSCFAFCEELVEGRWEPFVSMCREFETEPAYLEELRFFQDVAFVFHQGYERSVPTANVSPAPTMDLPHPIFRRIVLSLQRDDVIHRTRQRVTAPA